MPAAIAGLKGTSRFSTDERPKNWRETILHLFPNGDAPLTALSSFLDSEPVNDPEFSWWEKKLPVQRIQLDGAIADGVTTTFIVDDTSIFKPGHVVKAEETDEHVIVTSITNSTTMEVARAKGEVAGAALADDGWLLVVGSVYEEGAGSPEAIHYSPTKQYNLCQIMRTALGQTRTAKKTRLRWDATGPYREAKREGLQLHSIEMEKAFLFGQRFEEVGPNGEPRRTTRGMYRWITTNSIQDADTDGVWGKADFDSAMEEGSRYGASEKVVLAGSTAITTMTQWWRDIGQININDNVEVAGVRFTTMLTPQGVRLFIRQHPLMSDHPVYRKDMLVLDMSQLKYRYVDDTHFLKNRQARGTDATKDEYLSEVGLEVHHEETHALFKNMASYSASE